MLALAHGCVTQSPAPVARKSASPPQSTQATVHSKSTPSTVVEPNPAAPAVGNTEPAPAPLTLEQRLDKRAVTDEHYARRDLYSWTTPEQIRKLRQTNTLLVATAKTRGSPSPYSLLLA